jgi:hypothetical protein
MDSIKLPLGTKDLRIRHAKAIGASRFEGQITEQIMIEFLSDFTGLSVNKIQYGFDLRQIIKQFEHILDLYNGLKLDGKPPSSITLEGQHFDLIDFWKVASGWHMDNSKMDYAKDPVKLACMCYVPKGTKYGTMDENDNLVYPSESRRELFEAEFPLEAYVNLSAFFLLKLNSSMIEYNLRKKMTKKMQKILSKVGLTGRIQSTT